MMTHEVNFFLGQARTLRAAFGIAKRNRFQRVGFPCSKPKTKKKQKHTIKSGIK